MQSDTAHITRLTGLCAMLLMCSMGCGDGRQQTDSASSGLVFIREVAGVNEVMRVRLADGNETALTATPDRNERWPYWSRAANRLVFQEEAVEGGNSDLILWEPEAGVSAPLRESANRDERWPVWSPTDDRLVYAFRGGGPGPPAGIASEKISGGAIEVLAFSGAKDFFFRPSFSHDGSKLVAQRRGRDGVGSTLWMLAPNQIPKALTGDPNFFDLKPWFTSAGDRVVFSRHGADRELRDIAILTLETGAIRVIASSPDTDDHSGRPSPSRDEIAFTSNRGGNYNIFLTDFEGESVRALTTWSDRNGFAPRWSPDGERLVVTASRIGAAKAIANSHIVVIDRQGRVELDVPGAMADWMPAW